MKCPLCQVEMRISRTRYKTTQEPPIRLFAIQSLVCRSKQCENFGVVVEEVSHELAVNEELEDVAAEESGAVIEENTSVEEDNTVEENGVETEDVAEEESATVGESVIETNEPTTEEKIVTEENNTESEKVAENVTEENVIAE